MIMADRRIQAEQQRRRECGLDPLPTLRQLQRIGDERNAGVYRQGGGWVRSAWAAGYGAHVTMLMHYSYDDQPLRIVLAAALHA